MLGFLFAGALLGLATLAWPLYLHLRRRRQQVQEIPSLQLFQQVQRLNHKVNLQQLLLLLARLGLLVGLALLLAQPFVRSTRALPLPLAAGIQPPAATIGILVDDSLSARHGTEEATRLEHSQAWLREQLALMPEHAEYRLATTTSPFPSAPMTREHLLEAVAAMRILPRRGDAAVALERLATALAGQRGALLVAAPRSAQLWADLAPAADLPRRLPVHLLDTSAIQAPLYLESVSAETTAQARLAIRGDQQAMIDTRIHLLWGDAGSDVVRVTPNDALRGWLSVPLPELSAGTPLRLTTDPQHRHPWQHLWFLAGQREAALTSIVILRRLNPAEIRADKLMTAVLQAGFPEVALAHLDPTTVPLGELPASSVIITFGEPPPTRVHAWLNDRLAQGARVLAAPLEATGPEDPAPATLPWYPRWDEPESVPEAALPLRMQSADRVPLPGLQELLLAGLTELPVQSRVPLIEPPDGLQPVLVTADDAPLVRLGRQGDGRLVVLQTPLALSEASPLFHPLFPLLIAELVGEADGEAAVAEAVEVGDSVSLTAWFGRPRLEGLLSPPGGEPLRVRASAASPRWLPIETPGIYRLRQAGEVLRQVANSPREPDPTLAPREAWEAARPNTAVTWYDHPAVMPAEAMQLLGEGGALDEARTYDLGPLAAALAVLALLVEAVMLWRLWRRRDF